MKKIKKYDFVGICKLEKSNLKMWLAKEMQKYFDLDKLYNEDGFLYAKGNINILVTSHMDTVHKEIVKKVSFKKDEKGHTIISSPQGIGGDDRCGVWMILELLRKGYRPYVLFCEEEEIGGIGSGKFVKSSHINDLTDMRYLIELDRANANDAVFYDCGNKDFQKFIEDTTGYEKDFGSFSDISNLSPACNIASVNLSCGYYKAHTLNEYVDYNEMKSTLEVVMKLLDYDYSNEVDYWDYQEEAWYSKYDYGNGYGYGNGYYSSNKSYYGYGYSGYIELCIEYVDDNGNATSEYVVGSSETEALGVFFMDHPSVCFSDVLDYYESWEETLIKKRKEKVAAEEEERSSMTEEEYSNLMIALT